MLMETFHFAAKSEKIKYFLSIIVIFNFSIIFLSQNNFISNRNKYLMSTTHSQVNVSSSSLTDQIVLLRHFNDKCNQSTVKKIQEQIQENSPSVLARKFPWMSSTIFPVLSESLMLCATMKIASKTLISLLLYIYVRNVIQNSDEKSIHQHINISLLIAQLEKVF